MKKSIFGPQHTKIAPTIENIANLHVHNNTLDNAVDFYMQALKIYQRFYGPEHVCVYKVLTELGRMYVRRRDVDWTEKKFWKYCNDKERLYGDDDTIIFVPKHHCVATAYYKEAQRYKNTPKKAIELHTKGLELREELLPSTNNAIKQSLEAMVEVHTRESKPLSTLPYYEKIVDFLKAKHGNEDVVVGRYLAKIAPTFQQKGRFDAALDFYNQAIEIMERNDEPLIQEVTKRRIQLKDTMNKR